LAQAILAQVWLKQSGLYIPHSCPQSFDFMAEAAEEQQPMIVVTDFNPWAPEVVQGRVVVYDGLMSMYYQFVGMSFLNFAGIPTAYLLARKGLVIVSYFVVLPLSVMASIAWQYHWHQKMQASWTEVPTNSHGLWAAVFDEFLDGYQVPIVGIRLPQPHWLLAILMSAPEYADPLFDGVTAGSAEGLLDDAAARAFKDSWKWKDHCLTSKIVCSTMAAQGIAGALHLILVVSSLFQFVFFLMNADKAYWQLRRDASAFIPDPSDDCFLLKKPCFESLAAGAECANLGLVANLLGKLEEVHKEEVADWHQNNQGLLTDVQKENANGLPNNIQGRKSIKVMVKGWLENIPSAYFTISLFGLGLAFGTLGKLSIVTTALSIMTSLLSLLSMVKDHMFQRSKSKVDNFFTLACGFCSLVGLLTLLAKLCGAVVCGSQGALFSFWQGCEPVQ